MTKWELLKLAIKGRRILKSLRRLVKPSVKYSSVHKVTMREVESLIKEVDGKIKSYARIKRNGKRK